MDPQNLLFSRENPRPFAFPTVPVISSKPMPNEIAQKPSPSILVSRFKALLKEREDEFRASSGDDVPVPPPSTEEIVQIYQLLLSDLTCNLKPIITDLTIIAELQVEHARGIADAICARILEVCLGSRGKILTFSTVCNYIEIKAMGHNFPLFLFRLLQLRMSESWVPILPIYYSFFFFFLGIFFPNFERRVRILAFLRPFIAVTRRNMPLI